MQSALTEQEKNTLLRAAVDAQKRAYCPYSNFAVGCALITTAGDVYKGCNIENASYPAGICAERTAIVKAVSDGDTDIKAIAIITDSTDCASPCGICRQFIREFSRSESPIIVLMFNNDTSKCLVQTIDELLPHSFGPEDLYRKD